MSALWTIFRKELLDAFRDRRIVLVAFVIMPLAIPLVFLYRRPAATGNWPSCTTSSWCTRRSCTNPCP